MNPNPEIAHTPFASPDGALDAATSWEDAVDKIVEYMASVGRCYSSGEVANIIRSKRNDLVFRVGWVGERLRTGFGNGTLPAYDDGTGMPVGPVQVERHTDGRSRTPAGTLVFVYGPDTVTANAHDFEVNIPLPVSTDGTGAQAPLPAAQPGSPPAAPVVANGRQIPADAIAVVHEDGRLCVPRLAFEALAFATGRPVVGGQPLHVEYSGAVLTVAQDASPTTEEANPTSDRLRLHLTVPTTAAPTKVGDKFIVKVAGISGSQYLEIDLANPLP